MKVASTIGFERQHNELLREQGENRFVELALDSLGPQPPNFEAIVEVNRGPLPRSAANSEPLTPRQVEQEHRAGALIVDLRTALQRLADERCPGVWCVRNPVELETVLR